jgi:hypothetical protein
VFTLKNVVPWGRSRDEYIRMFTLTDADLCGRILGCGDGPASFNSEMTRRGGQVVSFDPIYQFPRDDLQRRIDETCETVMAQVLENQAEFVWDMIPSPEALRTMRVTAMRDFLADFDKGKHEGRYRVGELPIVPFENQTFDLALCSHFLFLYSDQFSAEFHRVAILEMCRVAEEVRIFPLLKLGSRPSQHVPSVVSALREADYDVSVEPVNYEFQRGGNQMMCVRRREML